MIRFSPADLQLFSDASSDRNPLHLVDAYAARTAYGQRVVFGALGAIACLGQMPLSEGTHLQHIDVEFRRPLFCGVDYRCEVGERAGRQTARLFDGSAQVLAMSLVLDSQPAIQRQEDGQEPDSWSEIMTAERRPVAEIVPGLRVSGEYRANRVLTGALASRWQTKIDLDCLEMLMLASYVVGMELPGETALFFRLILKIEDRMEVVRAPLRFDAAVQEVNNRLGHLRMSLEIGAEGRVVASGECHSFVRELPAELENATVKSDGILAGRTVAIIGASRGLGIATRRAFASRGADVYSLSRSAAVDGDEAGDGADPAALARFRARILEGRGRLDILICNACPPLVSLRLEPNALDRIADYIRHAVALTLAPMCTFLDLLNASSGTLVVISSAAVVRPVREWPHYLAAKQAVEALARIAPLQYPAVAALIVRPEKLMTAMVSTPVGRLELFRLQMSLPESRNSAPPER